MIKKLSAKLITIGLIIALTICLIPVKAKAAGGFYVDASYLSMQEGGSTGFSVYTDNAAGDIYVVASDGISASISESWLDSEGGPYSAYVSVYGGTAGNQYYVTLGSSTGGTYDDEDLSSWAVTVTIDVYGASDTGGNGGDHAAGDNETAPTETPDPDAEKRMVDIDGVQYTVQANIDDVETPVGFEVADDTYNNVPVKCFSTAEAVNGTEKYKIFVLQNNADSTKGLYSFDAKTKKFVPVQILVIGELNCIGLDLPEGFKIPTGYETVTEDIDGIKITGLKKVKDAWKNSDDTGAYKMPDINDDFVYFYAVTNGKGGFMSFDKVHRTLQRVDTFGGAGLKAEPESESPAALANTIEDQFSWDELYALLQKSFMVLVVALIIIVVLLVLLIRKGGRNKGNGPAPDGDNPETDGAEDTEDDMEFIDITDSAEGEAEGNADEAADADAEIEGNADEAADAEAEEYADEMSNAEAEAEGNADEMADAEAELEASADEMTNAGAGSENYADEAEANAADAAAEPIAAADLAATDIDTANTAEDLADTAPAAAVSAENDDIYEAIEEVDFLPEEGEDIIPEVNQNDIPAEAEHINKNPKRSSYDYDDEEFPVVGSFKPNETFDDDPDFLKDFDFEDLNL